MHSINNIAKIQLYCTSYLNPSQAICLHKWKQVSGVFLLFSSTEPAAQADRESKALPFKNKGRRRKEARCLWGPRGGGEGGGEVKGGDLRAPCCKHCCSGPKLPGLCWLHDALLKGIMWLSRCPLPPPLPPHACPPPSSSELRQRNLVP